MVSKIRNAFAYGTLKGTFYLHNEHIGWTIWERTTEIYGDQNKWHSYKKRGKNNCASKIVFSLMIVIILKLLETISYTKSKKRFMCKWQWAWASEKYWSQIVQPSFVSTITCGVPIGTFVDLLST